MKRESPLTPEQEAELHRRLLAGDPTAPADLAASYLEPLRLHLAQATGESDEAMCSDAAEDALLNLGERPQTCMEGRSLWFYLGMSASGDLKNLQKKRQRRKSQSVSLDSVEVDSSGGKWMQQPDALEAFILRDEAEHVRQQLMPIVTQGLSGGEAKALELLLEDVRETSAYAAALGIAHRPGEEQEAIVKKCKDKLKARIRRARDEQ